tara:strand:- start:7393 stop:8214 length:822 start_codon:yes stop_codon:yes gene_type:complete
MSLHGGNFSGKFWQDILPELTPQDAKALESKDKRLLTRSAPSTDPAQDPFSPQTLARQNPYLRATTLSTLNMHQHGELFVNFLRARRSVFIENKGWDLPQVDDMEFDQYDTPRARWIVLHEYGEVMGGVRLMPTTSVCAQYSYMLRDAQLGLLPDIPQDVLFFKAPVRDDIWEATRLFLSDAVAAHRRIAFQRILMNQMAGAAYAMGATHVLGIVPATFSRWMTRLRLMSAVPVGPVQNIDGDKTQAALMNVSYIGETLANNETSLLQTTSAA